MAKRIQVQCAVAAILIISSVAATAPRQAAASSDEKQNLAERTGNVGSTAYNLRLHKFEETSPPNVKRIREVFAEAGLKESTSIYVVQREVFHIYMIEENGEFRVLSMLSRNRG